MTQYFWKPIKHHNMLQTSFFHWAPSTAEGTKGNPRVCKGCWSWKRTLWVHIANISQWRYVGQGKTALPSNYRINIQGISSSNSLWYSWSWYMLVWHARLNNRHQFPVNNWSAFALLKVNGSFVIDLSGSRLGWLVFQNLDWMCTRC